MATTLSAGTYVFGKNVPNGIYDLTAIKGIGWLTPYDKDGDEMSAIRFGTESGGVKDYHGLDSDDVKKFTVEGSVEFEIRRATMIEIE